MHFIQHYEELKQIFDLQQELIELPGGRLYIRNIEFESEPIRSSYPGHNVDESIAENIRFRYPVIMHSGANSERKAIILLHGLNERTWHKHLTGATFLAEKTGKAVILFPLSFHINRGLPDWINFHRMATPLEMRKKKFPGLREASVANVALSDRLTEQPQRFYVSGLQSTMDLICLMTAIREGTHPLFQKGTQVDLFAYSISCMLLQSLMICNPRDILENSKIVLFAGGSLFSEMQGVSRFIMDSMAFNTLRNYYLNSVKNGLPGNSDPWFMEHSFGKAFRSMITKDFQCKERETAMENFHNNLMIIALQKDRIMPIEGIRAATGEKFYKSRHFLNLDFNYPYTHENPFPVLNNNMDDQVEQAFLSVFMPTMEFLN